MRVNFGKKTFLYPEPVFIIASYGEDGEPNAMNAAWGGISEECEISICVSAEHKTTENILSRKAFTVSMATADTVIPCDYVGIVSGNDVPDKLTRAGFHTERAEFVDAPIITELPLTVECSLISYDKQSCRLVGRIENISADEAILTNGKIDIKKLRPIIYDGQNHTYHEIGALVANAFSAGKAIK